MLLAELHLFESQFAACLGKLQILQQIVAKQQWQHLVEYANAYNNEVINLKVVCEQSNLPPKTYSDKFQHLDYRHRCVMRAVFQARERTTESIHCANQGLQKVNRLAEASKVYL